MVLRRVRGGLNRTFMELKWYYSSALGDYTDVSIVPLWNWNFAWASKALAIASVSIVPLWNWNVINDFLITQKRKSQSYLYGIEMLTLVRLWFMSQKSQSYLYGIEIVTTQLVVAVLVASQSYLYGIEMQPKVHYYSLDWSLNRTFMELKSVLTYLSSCSTTSQSYLYGIEIYIHDTYYELGGRLNRTFMELKSMTASGGGTTSMSQSYLYGIEINDNWAELPDGWESQSYLYGIEIWR